MNKINKEQEDLERVYAHQPWLAYIRCELAENAYDKSEFQKVTALAKMTDEDTNLALHYDIAGQVYVSTLKTLNLRALLKQERIEDALRCVEEYSEPCEDGDLLLARSMVFVEGSKLEQASLELDRSVSIDDNIVGRLTEKDLQRIERIIKKSPDNYAAAFCLSLHPAYSEEYVEARTALEALALKWPTRSQV